MIAHSSLGILPFTKSRELIILIYKGQITMAGNLKLKIFGTMKCASGKRMKVENRVFFHSVQEAIELGFRPCGKCLKNEYAFWKAKTQIITFGNKSS